MKKPWLIFGRFRNLEEKINLIMMGIGLFVLSFNFIAGAIRGYSFTFMVFHPSYYMPFLGLVLLFIFSRTRFMKHIQAITLFAIGSISMLSAVDEFFGFGLIILAVLLLFKYGFMKKRLFFKLIMLVICFLIIYELSVFRSSKSGLGLEVLGFVVFFIAMLYLIYQNEIQSYLKMNKTMTKEYESSLKYITKQRDYYLKQAESFTKQADDWNKKVLYTKKQSVSVDLDIYQLTKKQKEVVLLIAANQFSNKEIARELGISVSTVKVHLSNILNKMNLNSRTEIMGLFYDSEGLITETPGRFELEPVGEGR